MSKTLTYEQMMALFAKGRKETAELRANMEKGFAEGRKETAELRNSIAEGRKETAELRANMEKGFAEDRKETAKLRASIASLHIEVSDLKVIVEKNNARLDKAIAKLDENNAKLEKNSAKLDENNRKVGSLNNKLGGIIEHAVLPNIIKRFKEKGFDFKEVSERVEILNESETRHLAEVDALLENSEFVIAVEAKTDMKVSDVDAHIERLEVLRKLPRFKGKKIYGALATAVARKRPVNYALEQGFYVLQRPDVIGVKILDFPKGRSAKAW